MLRLWRSVQAIGIGSDKHSRVNWKKTLQKVSAYVTLTSVVYGFSVWFQGIPTAEKVVLSRNEGLKTLLLKEREEREKAWESMEKLVNAPKFEELSHFKGGLKVLRDNAVGKWFMSGEKVCADVDELLKKMQNLKCSVEKDDSN